MITLYQYTIDEIHTYVKTPRGSILNAVLRYVSTYEQCRVRYYDTCKYISMKIVYVHVFLKKLFRPCIYVLHTKSRDS